MRKTVVCQLALGRTRVSGYTLYDHESMAFEETTPREVKRLIKEGVVNGLRLDKQGEIQLDEKGFNCKNLLVKSGVGNFRPLIPSVDMLCNGMFALTKVACTDDGLVYEIVSNECARLPITEQKLRALYNVGCLYGCWINENTGMIEFAKGVEMLDMTSEAIEERLRQEAKEKEEAANGNNDVSVGTSADAGECAVGAGDPCSDPSCDRPDCEPEQSFEGGDKGDNGHPGFSEEAVTEDGFGSIEDVFNSEPGNMSYEAGEESLEEMLGIPTEPEAASGEEVETTESEKESIFDNLEFVDDAKVTESKKEKAPKKNTKSKPKKAK